MALDGQEDPIEEIIGDLQTLYNDLVLEDFEKEFYENRLADIQNRIQQIEDARNSEDLMELLEWIHQELRAKFPPPPLAGQKRAANNAALPPGKRRPQGGRRRTKRRLRGRSKRRSQRQRGGERTPFTQNANGQTKNNFRRMLKPFVTEEQQHRANKMLEQLQREYEASKVENWNKTTKPSLTQRLKRLLKPQN